MIRELIDTDLEAVAGGFFNLTNLTSINQQVLRQTNSAHQNAFAFGPGASALNVLGSQSNVGANSIGA